MQPSFWQAAIDADLVLATAGISAGEEDRVRDALRDPGAEPVVHKAAMKHGKPLVSGRSEDVVFISLGSNS
jgi:molybdopterin molybdotransferase